MPGRIREEDVALVKERADLADVVGDHVTLRSAGGGNLKGLCPFHDEKTPSFSVRPAVGAWHCFGCQRGGDTISFVMEIDHLSFAEAVERLAARVGIQLRYEEGGPALQRPVGQRSRLVAAHTAAATFYAEQLDSAGDAVAGRRFLDERGFDRQAAELFGVGYAPRTWDALVGHLRSRGFSDEELTLAGLARQGSRGTLIDRFVGRLMWPIPDISGDVVGFGARRLHEDDRVEAKYLNTADTPLFKKSQILYGIDRAKKDIARRLQAVVVEGYTDVMACHLAGVTTAVATCGTAFGADHVKILRRLLMDQDEFRGEVVFTFDGDAAGQQAALRAFAEDQRFVTQTFVAVEPSGMDPCELRQHKGDAAVRELVARRVPLFEFAIRSILGRHNLDTHEGREQARRAGMAVVRGIRDVALRVRYARELAGRLGAEENDLVLEAGGSAYDGKGRRVTAMRTREEDPARATERETLKLALQAPHLAGAAFDAVPEECYTAAPYRELRAAVAGAGGAASAAAGPQWLAAVRASARDDGVRALVNELAVEAVHARGAPDERYAAALVARLEEMATTRRIVEIKSRLQRVNPVDEPEVYNRTFGQLVRLEQHRRSLRDLAAGEL